LKLTIVCAEPHQIKKSDMRIRKNALKSAGAGSGNAHARNGKTKAKSRAGKEVLGNILLCQFHPGKVVNKVFSLAFDVCTFTDIACVALDLLFKACLCPPM
jgi:hypothetical protein